MAEFTSRYADADGIRTHYLEAGAGGPPLVLVHGGGAGADSWGNWRDCIPRYAPYFRVLAVDMVGFGKTDKPDPARYQYTQANRNRHLAAFIEALDLAPAHLIGNSMGGATALGVAMTRPELVDRMVLMGSAGLAISNPDPDVRKALVEYDFTVEGMHRLMRTLTGRGFQLDEDLVRYRHALTIDPATRAALEAIHKATRSEGLAYPEQEIRKVKTPTLVVGGKEDKIAVLARTYGFLELLENSWGFVLPRAGHWVMIERPDEFVAVTEAFLRLPSFGRP
jgi:pimeloyl-ACP methyl ester carboxylesterase